MKKEKVLVFEEKLNRIKNKKGNVELNEFLNLLKEDLQEENNKLDEELARELDGVDVLNEISKM